MGWQSVLLGALQALHVRPRLCAERRWCLVQENGRLPGDEYSYSGCQSTPRELSFQCAQPLHLLMCPICLLRSFVGHTLNS